MNTIPVKVHNRFDFELTDAKTVAGVLKVYAMRQQKN